MVMVQKIAGHEPARKIGDMRVTGKKSDILGSSDKTVRQTSGDFKTIARDKC